MRAWLLAVAVLAVLASAAIDVTVQGDATAQQGAAAQCKPGSRALGVSRTVEIDTAGGPRFGNMQYKDITFLADREVVLTFDDGPSRTFTRSVLDALDAHCTKATFLMVGRMAVADPEMVREVDRRGHTVGTHTWSHRNLRGLTPQRAEAEIELGISAVSRALGKPVAPFFRFPYLADSAAMMARLEKRNIANLSIDVDSKDFRTADPRTMQNTVMQRLAVAGKGIILFHDIQASTARGLGALLDELKAKGYRVVHIVPKTPAVTVSSYDETAASELARKTAAANANPMVKRSVVWPNSPAAPAPTASVAKGPSTGSPAATRASAPAPAPVASGGATSSSPPAPAPEPRLRGPVEDSWQGQVFSR